MPRLMQENARIKEELPWRLPPSHFYLHFLIQFRSGAAMMRKGICCARIATKLEGTFRKG
jgi:hypothetical protein